MAENIENIIDNENQEQEPNQEGAKTYTQEEVLALLQSETDKRVTQALKKQQKKYETQLSLSKLDGDAREKAEKDNRIAELEDALKNSGKASRLSAIQRSREEKEKVKGLVQQAKKAEYEIQSRNDEIEKLKKEIASLEKKHGDEMKKVKDDLNATIDKLSKQNSEMDAEIKRLKGEDD